MIAEACNPAWTSVPLLAYYWYRALRKHVDVTLVTQVRNRTGFARCAPSNDVVFIDSEPLAAPLHKLANLITFGHPTALGTRQAISWPAYLYFEHLVWKRFGRRVCAGEYDLVHRLTPVSPTVPSPIAAKCPVPFVLGPLNGALPWPPGMENIRSREGEWLAPLRDAYRLQPYWRRTFNRAALVIAAARNVQRSFPNGTKCSSVIVPENGVDTDRFSPEGANLVSKRRPFTILFVGRLVPFKQPSLILEAVARLRDKQDQIRVLYVGDGPERTRILATADHLALTPQVELVDAVPHDQLPAYYRTASLLALPSVHESGGAVILEAMACGLPCVVVDYGGPSEYVNSQTGIKVPLGSHDTMVAGFATVLKRYLEDPAFLATSSQAARRLAETRFSWLAKAEQMVRLYRCVLADWHPPRPCPTAP